MTESKQEKELKKCGVAEPLRERIRRRATSLECSVDEYLARITDRDTVLPIDRGIAAIVMAWVPLWLLLGALTYFPQGKELLAQLASSAQSAAIFVGMLLLLCIVATCGATALIAAWLYPRLGFDRPFLYRPKIPKNVVPLNGAEIEDVIRSARWPIIVAIGLPIALLTSASFASIDFHWRSVLILVTATLVISLLIWVVVRWTAPRVLYLVAWSFVVMASGLLGLITIGWMPALLNSHVTTEVLTVVTAALWLFTFFGFSFIIYQSRDKTVPRGWPSFLGQHFTLIMSVAMIVAFHSIKGWIWPYEPNWMLPASVLGSTTANSTSPLMHRRASASDAFRDFKLLHDKEDLPPLILVTAAGGGIRAAYWSAAVLATLQDRQSAFAKHVFAISAVSGGALGSSAFKAFANLNGPNCPSLKSYKECTAGFLSGDFIGPNILAAATSDVVGLLSAGLSGVMLVSRDDALEQAWSLRWRKFIADGPSLDGAFDELFTQTPFPALLLNGTSVRTGNRVITSNLDLATLNPRGLRQSEPTSTPANATGITTSGTSTCIVDRGIVNPAQHLRLSVSSAVLTSARFPYITPPGLLRLPGSSDAKKSCREWEEIVDGGFIDNEGVITMHEVLDTLVNLSGGVDNLRKTFRLVVIRLSAEPLPLSLSHDKNQPPKRERLDQLYGTVMNQRAAAGQKLVSDFRDRVRSIGGTWVELNALDDDAPLGWTLSDASRQRLDAWLAGPSSQDWIKAKRELPPEDLMTLQKFAEEVDMPGRIETILSQFRVTGAAQ